MTYLVATDLSDASLLALDALSAFVGDESGDVTLLHVVDLDLYTAGGSVPGIMEFAQERRPGVGATWVVHVARDAAVCDDARARFEALMQVAPAGMAAGAEVLLGKPAEVVLEAAAKWNATTIVVSPCAHSALHRAVWGSVAREIAVHAPCSVLFVPPTV